MFNIYCKDQTSLGCRCSSDPVNLIHLMSRMVLSNEFQLFLFVDQVFKNNN